MKEKIDFKIIKNRCGEIGNNIVVAGLVASFFSESVSFIDAFIVMIIGIILIVYNSFNKESV